ncbi:MAG: hypothetical protein GY749_23625 [Desulfobacteraceae bacterium]|nr:hypothetical protein [Desulfobacteraceae bacterium]
MKIDLTFFPLLKSIQQIENFHRRTSFPRSAWECSQDAPRPGMSERPGHRASEPPGRGASGLHSHAERGNEDDRAFRSADIEK